MCTVGIACLRARSKAMAESVVPDANGKIEVQIAGKLPIDERLEIASAPGREYRAFQITSHPCVQPSILSPKR